jgi:tRNA(fMet)-specific endonuclease VapC
VVYLLDTDVLSNILRPRPNQGLVSRLEQTPLALQFTSAINLAELLYAVERRGGIRLRNRIEEIVAHLPILPFDEDAARIFGSLRANLDRRETPLDEADLQIASIALASRLTLVTGNLRHFGRVPGLTIENWLVDS